MSKKKRQIKHAARRANQRYGVSIRNKEIVQLIKDGKSIVLERQSLRITVRKIFLDERWIPIVYDSKRHVVVTFLPEEALDNKYFTDGVENEAH